MIRSWPSRISRSSKINHLTKNLKESMGRIVLMKFKRTITIFVLRKNIFIKCSLWLSIFLHSIKMVIAPFEFHQYNFQIMPVKLLFFLMIEKQVTSFSTWDFDPTMFCRTNQHQHLQSPWKPNSRGLWTHQLHITNQKATNQLSSTNATRKYCLDNSETTLQEHENRWKIFKINSSH